MKWFARLAAFALLALSIPASARVGGIEAESIDTFSGLAIALSAERSFATAAEDIHVQLTFANAGKSPLAVNRMYLPEGELDDPLFDISVDGRAVEYQGPIVKRGAPTAEDFVWL
jgi:peptidyl-Lys metalloendopeptidase